jgi:predicted 3-demethylubiquinone-9 3-methyltransferase (glyoxalase superfamily)
LSGEDEAGVARATEAMLGMKKIDITELESAYKNQA